VLPLSETTIHSERFGTRHRAALGTTEQTDAIVIVVSEENSQVSLVHRARIVRNLNENQLARTLRGLLEPNTDRSRFRIPSGTGPGSRRLPGLGRAMRTARRDGVKPSEPLPPDEPMVPASPAGGPAADAPTASGPAPTADAVPAQPEAEATAEETAVATGSRGRPR
jgi:hypothetical protein